jgi:hypothetical protein
MMIQSNIRDSFGKMRSSASPLVHLEPPLSSLPAPAADRRSESPGTVEVLKSPQDNLEKFAPPATHKQQHTFTSDLDPELKFLMFDQLPGVDQPGQRLAELSQPRIGQPEGSFSSLDQSQLGLLSGEVQPPLSFIHTQSQAGLQGRPFVFTDMLDLNPAVPQAEGIAHNRQKEKPETAGHLPAEVFLKSLMRSGLKPELSMASILAQADLDGQGQPAINSGQLSSPSHVLSLDSLHSLLQQELSDVHPQRHVKSLSLPAAVTFANRMDFSRHTDMERMSENEQEAVPIIYSQPYPELLRTGQGYDSSYQPLDLSGFGSPSGTGQLRVQPPQGAAFRQDGEMMFSGPGLAIMQDRSGHTRLHEDPSFQPSVPDLSTRRTPPDLLPFLGKEILPGSTHSNSLAQGPINFIQNPDLTGFKQSSSTSLVQNQGSHQAEHVFPQVNSYKSTMNQPGPGSSHNVQLPHAPTFSNLIGEEGRQPEPMIGQLPPTQMFSNMISGNGRVLEPMQPIGEMDQYSAPLGDMHVNHGISEAARREHNATPGNITMVSEQTLNLV